MDGMRRIKTYKVFNESLKDKLKGKSEEDIDELLLNILLTVTDDLATNTGFFKNHEEAFHYVSDNYFNDITDSLSRQHSSKNIIERIRSKTYEDKLGYDPYDKLPELTSHDQFGI